MVSLVSQPLVSSFFVLMAEFALQTDEYNWFLSVGLKRISGQNFGQMLSKVFGQMFDQVFDQGLLPPNKNTAWQVLWGRNLEFCRFYGDDVAFLSDPFLYLEMCSFVQFSTGTDNYNALVYWFRHWVFLSI